jgi:hypothetical protein
MCEEKESLGRLNDHLPAPYHQPGCNRGHILMTIEQQVDALTARINALSAKLATIDGPTDPRLTEIISEQDAIKAERNKLAAFYEQNTPNN